MIKLCIFHFLGFRLQLLLMYSEYCLEKMSSAWITVFENIICQCLKQSVKTNFYFYQLIRYQNINYFYIE